VRQLLDMTTGLDFNEDTDEGNRKFGVFLVGAGLVPPPSGYAGPRTSFEALSAVRKVSEHGQRFDYQSVTTETLGLIVARVSGKRSDVVLSERIWSQLGAEHDADIVVDRAGTPVATAGLSATLRDFARFGEMIRRGGFFNGRQIVPASVVAKIRAGGRKSDFASALFDYDTRRGWSYRSQWWVRHNFNGAFMAIGAYGQTIYIDPTAEMVVVRFTSNPVSSTVGQDVVTLPVFDTLAAHLITTASPRGSKSSR
jgi:CubicO group peptidase (beta-lactamase class C family)